MVLRGGDEVDQKRTPPVDNLVAQVVTLPDNRIDTLTRKYLNSNHTTFPYNETVSNPVEQLEQQMTVQKRFIFLLGIRTPFSYT